MHRPSHHLSCLGLALAALAAFSVPAQAQPGSAASAAEQRFDKRQARQEERIDQGVKTGALTPREARRLQHQQAGVQRAEDRAEADGKLTRGEAARLERREDRTSRHIARQKHDQQVRP